MRRGRLCKVQLSRQLTVIDTPYRDEGRAIYPLTVHSPLGSDGSNTEPDAGRSGWMGIFGSSSVYPQKMSQSPNPIKMTPLAALIRSRYPLILLDETYPPRTPTPRNGVSTPAPKTSRSDRSCTVPSISILLSRNEDHRCSTRGLDDRKYHAQNEQPGKGGRMLLYG